MTTYLVTGGAGFIGSNFIIYMLKKYSDIKIINIDSLTYAGNLDNLSDIENKSNYNFVKADICDFDAVKKIFSENDINFVVNFAAESHVDRSINEPDVFVKTNVFGTVNLLNCAKNSWQIGEDKYKENHKFIQVSTDEVYGSLGEEGYFTETTPLSPHSPYSSSKASADLFVKAYFDTYKMPVNITRCSNNYGPYQFPEKLIPLMINNTLSGKKLPVYGDGLQIRDWLYVEDHVKAIELTVQKGVYGEIYNIGGNNEKTNIDIIKNIINCINEETGKNIDYNIIEYVKDRKGHDRRYAIDASKIENKLGWYPETKFEDGIKKTIKWYLDNAKWLNNITSGSYKDYYKQMYEN